MLSYQTYAFFIVSTRAQVNIVAIDASFFEHAISKCHSFLLCLDTFPREISLFVWVILLGWNFLLFLLHLHKRQLWRLRVSHLWLPITAISKNLRLFVLPLRLLIFDFLLTLHELIVAFIVASEWLKRRPWFSVDGWLEIQFFSLLSLTWLYKLLLLFLKLWQ